MSKNRGKRLGKKAIELLNEMMVKDEITALFVDVIPRTIGAIEFYRE